MELELKNIKMHKGHDDDHCYSASLYIDGQPIALVANDGWGGGETYEPHPKANLTGQQVYDVIKKVDAWYRTQATVGKFSDGEPMYQRVDGFCTNAVNDFLMTRMIKRELKTKTVVLKDGEIWVYKVAFNPMSKVRLIKQIGECKIINEMPIEEAIKTYREFG